MKTFKTQWHGKYQKYRADNYEPARAKALAIHDVRYGAWSRKRWILPNCTEPKVTELPNGWKLRVVEEYDTDSGPPEKDSDCCGVVVSKHRQRYSEYSEEKCWALSRDWRYDVNASLEKALRDEWDAPPFGIGTKQERAMRAVKRDYEYLSGWYDNQWYYVGLIVELLDENDTILEEESCWGFKSDDTEYLCSEARSWAAHMVVNQRRIERETKRQEKIASRFRDAMSCGV